MGDRVPDPDLNGCPCKCCHCKGASSRTYNINVTAPDSDAYTIGEALKKYLDDYGGGAA